MPRPVPTFHDFVGQKKVVDLLLRQLNGVQSRGEPFPHTLVTGTSGLGKTMLAQALAAEYKTAIVMTIGDISKTDLVDRLVALSENDFLFIDEAHALKGALQELLYEAIDSLRVPRVQGSVAASAPQKEGEDAVEIKPCSIILATDQPGGLLNALQKRMSLKVALTYYPIEELKAIVDRMATSKNLLLSPQAARLIAQVSAGLPRRVKHHLQNLRNHFRDSERHQLSVTQVREFLMDFDIDDKGLGTQERQYLDYLKDVGSASLESLAICLGLDTDYVHRQVEQILLRERLVKIGHGGRQLTPMGLDWINKNNNTNAEHSTDGPNKSGQIHP
jgi:Holliday junction DNA helicase RuvB